MEGNCEAILSSVRYHFLPAMGLLPDTQNCGLRMRRGCRERLPRYRLRRKPLDSDPGMHHGACVTHVPWCMSGSLTRGGGKNVPGISGACGTTILRIWQEAHGAIRSLFENMCLFIPSACKYDMKNVWGTSDTIKLICSDLNGHGCIAKLKWMDTSLETVHCWWIHGCTATEFNHNHLITL